MQNEELPSFGYDYTFIGGVENLFVFETKSGITYDIKFKPTFYLFETDPVLKEQVFELTIIPTNPSRVATPSDSLTGLTISAIINDFYQRYSSVTVTLFICDDSDRREAARHRKFGSWFTAYNQEKFTKFDFEWKDHAEKTIYVSVIIAVANPYASLIKERFEILSNAFGEDK